MPKEKTSKSIKFSHLIIFARLTKCQIVAKLLLAIFGAFVRP